MKEKPTYLYLHFEYYCKNILQHAQVYEYSLYLTPLRSIIFSLLLPTFSQSTINRYIPHPPPPTEHKEWASKYEWFDPRM